MYYTETQLHLMTELLSEFLQERKDGNNTFNLLKEKKKSDNTGFYMHQNHSSIIKVREYFQVKENQRNTLPIDLF